MRLSPTLLASALFASTLICHLSASVGRAQEAPPTQGAPARAAFEEGREHFDDHRYLLAAEAFQRAYDLMREAEMPNAWMILFNVGTSLDEIRGRERDARDAYAGFLEHAQPTDAESQRRMSVVESRIRELDLRLAEAGTSDGTTMSPVGPIVLGVGGATVIAGAIVAAVLAMENDAFLAMCNDGVCPSSARASAESVQGLATATDVLLIGGGVVAATGLVLTLLLRDGAGETPPVSAGCSGEGCTVQFRGEL